jgi:hypothetical protein
MGHEFPLIEVSGSAYEMGRQHGAQARELVHKYLLWIDKLTGKPRDLLCRNAMALEPYMRALGPQFLEEVRGLADGAGISYQEAVLCQCRAEAARQPEGGCTAFALCGEATADRSVLAGQNQDLEPEYADVGILLHVRPNDGRPRSLSFTFAGQLGYAGMNEHGVANFANALYDFQWRPGIPYYPLRRALVEQRDVAGAVEVLRRHRACSALNLVLCDGRGGIVDVEVRPEGVAVFQDAHADTLLHANHYLTRQFAPCETNSLADSCPRLDRIRELVKQSWGRTTVDTMKAIMADHAGDPAGICRHGAVKMHSISGYIAEPAKGLLHVRRGHGCTGTWRAYEV